MQVAVQGSVAERAGISPGAERAALLNLPLLFTKVPLEKL